MMLNLFSIFDPTTTIFSLNWISMLLVFFFSPVLYWNFKNRMSMLNMLIMKSLNFEFSNNFMKANYKTFSLFFSLFFYILTNNFIGLFPYIFTASSHLSFSLSLSLPFWLTFMFYGWVNFSNHMFTHLVPLGTPIFLASFMVLIETISNLIRPITLSVRLTANMIAGHLLLSLLSGMSEKMFFIYPMSMIFMFSLLCLEMAVSVIQSYVFITLMSLYFNEI